MPRDDDELSFAELMAREGVEPLDERGTRAGDARDGGARTRGAGSGGSRARGSSGRGSRSSGAGQDRGRARTGPRSPGSTPRAATPDAPAQCLSPPPPAVDLGTENARLSAAVAELEARATAAEAALDQARQALDAAEQVRHTLDVERRNLADQSRRLREELGQHEQDRARHVSLRAVLEERGLVDDTEMVAVLEGLLAQHAHELLDAVELTSRDRLIHLLDQRVALVHDPARCELGQSCVVVRVPPERCELTGGSDIRAAFRRLVAACQHAGAGYLTIVGGSPAYRRQLDALAEPHRPTLRLNLVSGTKRRERRRAEADMRKSDLVVIWGATELDHSVSGLYTGDAAPILRVPHRGISRMLERVAAWLDARPPRGAGSAAS